MEIASSLKEKLKGTVVVVGIGNITKGDDGAGPELIRRLKLSKLSTLNSKLFLLDVGEVPENYLERIIQYKPDTILLIDAVDFRNKPGEVRIFNSSNIGNTHISTHCGSLSLVINYLKKESTSEIFLIGIQPQNLNTGEKLSAPVSSALEEIVDGLKQIFSVRRKTIILSR